MRRLRSIAILLAVFAISSSLASSGPPAFAGVRSPVAAGGPVARFGAGLATDPSGHVVLFGGSKPNNHGGYDVLGDTWSWDGSAWTQRHPSVTSAPRDAPFMSYDVHVLRREAPAGGAVRRD